MQPLELDRQRTLRFNVTTSQRAKMFAYRDHYGNAVHCFDIPGHHARLDVSVESAVDVSAAPTLPRQLPDSAWTDFDGLGTTAEHIDWLLPSPFTEVTPALQQFARAIGLDRRQDPLTTLRTLNATVFAQFAYEPRTTSVDSQIDEALRARAGVCQDFSHIMIALLRSIGIPCRDTSAVTSHRASRTSIARVTMPPTRGSRRSCPRIGWIGFDPTNNTIAAIGTSSSPSAATISDVPPTRGVFKGDAGSELSVAVAVTPASSPIAYGRLTPSVSWIVPPRSTAIADEDANGNSSNSNEQGRRAVTRPPPVPHRLGSAHDTRHHAHSRRRHRSGSYPRGAPHPGSVGSGHQVGRPRCRPAGLRSDRPDASGRFARVDPRAQGRPERSGHHANRRRFHQRERRPAQDTGSLCQPPTGHEPARRQQPVSRTSTSSSSARTPKTCMRASNTPSFPASSRA